MALDELTIVIILVVANIATYLLLMAGIVRARRSAFPPASNAEEAFAILERSLKATFPDLPEGFTWNEVVARLRTMKLEMNWADIEVDLRQYEAYRYGGIRYTNINTRSVLRLASSLPRGERYASRS